MELARECVLVFLNCTTNVFYELSSFLTISGAFFRTHFFKRIFCVIHTKSFWRFPNDSDISMFSTISSVEFSINVEEFFKLPPPSSSSTFDFRFLYHLFHTIYLIFCFNTIFSSSAISSLHSFSSISIASSSTSSTYYFSISSSFSSSSSSSSLILNLTISSPL